VSAVEPRSRGRIGALVPSSNINLETDFELLLPPGVTAHFTRIGEYDPDAVPDVDEMESFSASDAAGAARLLVAADVGVIAYGCTSGTFFRGAAFDREVRDGIAAAAGVPVVTAAGSLVAALGRLDVRRVAVAAPYVPELLDRAVAFLEESGLDVVGRACPRERLTSVGQRALGPQDAYELAMEADSPDAEAIVLSCTDLRSVEAIDAIERDCGKPVVTSNQALVIAALGHLGIEAGEMPAGGRARLVAV
jgi:maleate isomerase